MIYALVQDGFIVNVVSTEDVNFVDYITKDYDEIIRIDDNPNPPSVGWMYTSGSFQQPSSDRILVEAKKKKIELIDKRTSELITFGFSYKGKNFSMSDAAQRNWIGLAYAKGMVLILFPFIVSCVDEGTYTITDTMDFTYFIIAFMQYQTDLNLPLGKGRILKALVNAAASVDEVNGIVDPR